jgi:hypothetical protein
MRSIVCHKCRHKWDFENIIGRTEECPKCHWDAHVCLNCKHYDRAYNRECREPEPEYVKDKQKGNFCDFFDPKSSVGPVSGEAEQAKSALDSLFGGTASAAPTQKTPEMTLAEQLKKFLDKK